MRVAWFLIFPFGRRGTSWTRTIIRSGSILHLVWSSMLYVEAWMQSTPEGKPKNHHSRSKFWWRHSSYVTCCVLVKPSPDHDHAQRNWKWRGHGIILVFTKQDILEFVGYISALEWAIIWTCSSGITYIHTYLSASRPVQSPRLDSLVQNREIPLPKKLDQLVRYSYIPYNSAQATMGRIPCS